jgi:hypothetical protein
MVLSFFLKLNVWDHLLDYAHAAPRGGEIADQSSSLLQDKSNYEMPKPALIPYN